ncbi:cytochrome c [Geomonas sp. Red32]|uniref:c-type cytochrome n=1 Tax=Geomonas sp. Red32 TaxID=2912856 RepID=UPI00202CAE17|nr:cytochrome c [Geomonas sp. Red32]MCM0080463.1 cytochrome c [Geomonas sp. Red32]
MKTPAANSIDTWGRRGLKGAMVALALTLAACGGGGGGGNSPAAVNNASSQPVQSAAAANGSFLFTTDNYGMENANFVCATSSNLGLVLRAAVATGVTDPNFRTVARIDVATPGQLATGTSYSLDPAASSYQFPGAVYFFNGHQSTLLKTVGGTISFTSLGTASGQAISGTFDAQVEDDSDPAKPVYRVAASFSFASEGAGAILPAPAPVPAIAASTYNANCAACHTLGSLDSTQGSGPDLALKGGKLTPLFPANATGHNGVNLSAAEVSALKVFLNVN